MKKLRVFPKIQLKHITSTLSVSMNTCMLVQMYAYAYGGQVSTSVIFLLTLHLIFLSQDLSLNLEPNDPSRLGAQQASGFYLWHPSSEILGEILQVWHFTSLPKTQTHILMTVQEAFYTLKYLLSLHL